MSAVNLTYAECSLLIENDPEVYLLVSGSFDGLVKDLLKYEGRYIRARLVHRALRESYFGQLLPYYVNFAVRAVRFGFTSSDAISVAGRHAILSVQQKYIEASKAS